MGLAEVLNEQGYTVVRFEPTGTWESDGDISEYTTTQYLKDIKSVIEYMLKQSHYTKILLGGHSRGGQVSVLYAARDSRISIVLGIMPSSGPVEGQVRADWQKAGVKISQREMPGDKNKNIEFCVPFSHVLDRDKYDAVGDAIKIKVPMVLIAGEKDDVVLPSEVKDIFDNANEPKKFLVISDIGHDYRHNDKEISLVNEKILEQLNSVENKTLYEITKNN
jgi:alpha-beta hydrolase superfamily lysophospholipase